jgi:nicotinate-nucleotide pyrophosphorylase (carboxylating)
MAHGEENVLSPAVKEMIRLALREDLGDRDDITTQAICPLDSVVHAKIIAKQNGILCGVSVAAQVFRQVDENSKIEFRHDDGVVVKEQECIIEIDATAETILKAERTALNFLGRLSGIATLTGRFVDKIKDTDACILDTRKTTPGMRELEKYAVKCAGGANHRFGLFDMFLIKENHISVAGGITTAVEKCRAYLAEHGFSALIEVETKTAEQVREAIAARVDRIMLDNMSPDEIRDCVRLVNKRIPLEASGNVILESVRAVAETGVDFVSVGALTHSAPNFDFSLLIAKRTDS